MPFHPSHPHGPVLSTAGARPMRWLLLAAATAALVACGGGGDSSPTNGSDNGGSNSGGVVSGGGTSGSSQPIPEPAGLPSPSAVCTGALRNDVLAYVNAYRAAGATCASGTAYPAGGSALAWSNELESAALAHSQAMINTNEFAHVVTGEANLGPRIAAAGYAYTSARENIAAGAVYSDVAKVVAAWMNSKTGHCDNIMAADLQHVAVACLPGNAGNTYMNYWTMDLGRR